MADSDISTDEWKAARTRIETRRRHTEKRLLELTNTTVLDGFIGIGDALRGQWVHLPLNRQRAIVAAVLDHAVIGPATPPRNRFDPSRVTPIWRL